LKADDRKVTNGTEPTMDNNGQRYHRYALRSPDTAMTTVVIQTVVIKTVVIRTDTTGTKVTATGFGYSGPRQ